MTLDDEDIQTLVKVFATKDDLERFATKEDLRLFKEELEEKFVTNEKFNEALGTLDQIAGDTKAIREEQVAHQAKHDRIEEDLTAIKAIPAIAHELR